MQQICGKHMRVVQFFACLIRSIVVSSIFAHIHIEKKSICSTTGRYIFDLSTGLYVVYISFPLFVGPFCPTFSKAFLRTVYQWWLGTYCIKCYKGYLLSGRSLTKGFPWLTLATWWESYFPLQKHWTTCEKNVQLTTKCRFDCAINVCHQYTLSFCTFPSKHKIPSVVDWIL